MNRPGILDRVHLHAADAAHLEFRDQHGRRCAVYARRSVPAGAGPHPVVIHAPGGGQTVSDADLAWWCAQGFACVAFDWQHGLYDHDPRFKSQWPDGVVQQGQPAQQISQMIIPLAVEAVGVVIDWMTQDPRCAAHQIGLTGISWGGYLTWVANAHEPRLKAAVAVYGCGGLFEPGHACAITVHTDVRAHWLAHYEPFHLAQRQIAPLCFLSGTNDFFGWPVHAEDLLARLTVPHRRCYLPNADHAVDPGGSRLAVAWMRQYLCGGPAIPAEPMASDAGEPWHTFSAIASDRACWWPGLPPAGATAHFIQQRHPDGVCVSSAIQLQSSKFPVAPLPTVWPDARAGVGYHWGLSTTQLHGNEAAAVVSVPGDLTRARITGSREAGLGVILRHLADPRWNTPDFRGMRMHLSCPGQVITLRWHLESGDRRWIHTSEVAVDSLGWLTLTTAPAPWSHVARVDLENLPGPTFILGPIERLA